MLKYLTKYCFAEYVKGYIVFMQRWSEAFLRSVSRPAVMNMVREVQRPCANFEEKLHALKSNIFLSTAVDRDNFREISWDGMVDKKIEIQFLNKIRQQLDVMALTPLGKDILSGLRKTTAFGVAPIELPGSFFDRSTPTVFLKASEAVFKNNTLVFKILIHECAHAKNAEVGELANISALSPRLMFMQHMLNELSAYLSEHIVISQRKDKKFTGARQTQEQVIDCLDHLHDGDYVQDFSERVIRRNRGIIFQPDSKIFPTDHLRIFAYYFQTYPALCDLTVINMINQLYNHHVIRKVRKRNMVLARQKTRQYS